MCKMWACAKLSNKKVFSRDQVKVRGNSSYMNNLGVQLIQGEIKRLSATTTEDCTSCSDLATTNRL